MCGPDRKGQCLPKEKKCDGYFDCRNKHDEDDCGANHGVSCALDQYRCLNRNRCIEATLKCDYKDDCGDNSDEEGCSKY